MCKAIEEMIEKERAEAKLEGEKNVYLKMCKNGLSIEQIAELVDIPEEEIRELLGEW